MKTQFTYAPKPVDSKRIKTLDLNFWQRLKLRYQVDASFNLAVFTICCFVGSLMLAVTGVVVLYFAIAAVLNILP